MTFLEVLVETATSENRTQHDLPINLNVKGLLSKLEIIDNGDWKTWLKIEPGPVWIPLLPDQDLDTSINTLAQLYHGTAKMLLCRSAKEPSPVTSPILARKPMITKSASSPKLKELWESLSELQVSKLPEGVANETEPFTQEKVISFDLKEVLELELEDGRVMVVHLESLLPYISSEREKGVSLGEVVVHAVDRHGRKISCKLTRSVWSKHLLRANELWAEFVTMQLFNLEVELKAQINLMRLNDDALASKGLRFLHLDASKSNLGDAKSRKDRLDRSQFAPGFISPIYFPKRATREFLKSFHTPAGVTYLQLFAQSFGQRMQEGSACTGHELAPLLKGIFKLPQALTEDQEKEYTAFNTYWQALTVEQKNNWSLADGDAEPTSNKKGKGRKIEWPFR